MRRLTAAEGLLSAFRGYLLDDGVIRFVKDRGVGKRRFLELETAVREIKGVEWVAPAFVYSPGMLTRATDGISLKLKPGVDPETFFGDRFEHYERAGPDNIFFARLRDKGGVFALNRANLQRNPNVIWAAPNFYSDIQFYDGSEKRK